MSRASGVLAAMKAVPGGARYTPAPQSGGWGGMNQVAANAMYGNPGQSSYGPFLPRPSRTFTDGAFGPMSPIQPVPLDEPATPGGFPDPRYWQYPVGWNLPTQPGAEGLKLASFAQLQTIASKYNVARRAIELRKEEIAGLEWSIELTKSAAKAYQGDHKAMRDFGERAAEATRFFRHPDPDYFDFGSFLKALLEEILVFDALALIFRPKYGKGLGRGLLGSDLDSLSLISGPTIRPLLNMHGGKPRPPAPAYSQFLYGVPRSDYQTVISGADIDDYGLTGAEVNQFRADTMLYLPLVPRRESPYGFPPIEQALLPIISGLQKQEFQLQYFTEGTIPAVYISPGDPNMTPTQIKELQDALNGIAGDPAYHLKVIVLPPGSKVDPQRPVDLSDSFDYLVMNQVLMQLDVMPTELGIVPDIGATQQGPSASGIKLGAQASRDPKSRKSTKPLLMTLCGIANYVLQDICGQHDMKFSFEGLQDDEDKAAITQLGVEQVQNGISSIDEVRDRLDMPPWGLQETSEPVVFTAQGPIPFSMAPQLIANMQGGGGQGTNSGQRTTSSRTRNSQPAVRRGGQTKPNGSHEAPLAPHRESVTPAHSAAAGAIQSPGPRTGGTPSRSSVAGSRKKAVDSELGALARHLRKGRQISTWVAEHIPERALGMIAEDIAKGVLIDTAVERAGSISLAIAEGGGLDGPDPQDGPRPALASYPPAASDAFKSSSRHWPGWERDLGLVGAYKNLIGQAFHDAEAKGSDLRRKAATGGMYVSNATLRDLISDEVRDVFSGVLAPLWTEAWHLGYAAAKSLVTGAPADFSAKGEHSEALAGFIGSEGEHWLQQVSRTGLGNNSVRAELIARTEVARAVGSAAIQCYRDYGITHKHLLLSPNACDLCKDAADDGEIPLDAVFSAGGVLGLVHPACVVGSTRVAAPARGEVVSGQEAHGLTLDASVAAAAVTGDRGLASASAVAVAERDFGRGNIRAVSEREYVGDVITIRTASGYELTATPNHPVATRGGWVSIADLAVGGHVLSSTGREWVSSADPDVDDVPPCIEEVAQTFPVAFAPMPTAPEDFHGDGAGSEVHVVRTDRLLVDNRQISFGEHVSKRALGLGDVPAETPHALDSVGDLLAFSEADDPASQGFMGIAREFAPLLGGHAGRADIHGGAAVTGLDASLQEAAADTSAIDAVGLSKSVLAFPGEIPFHNGGNVHRRPESPGYSGVGQPPADVLTADAEGFCDYLATVSPDITTDEIVDVRRHEFAGQVYNLETVDGWYIGNGIVTHNCRCVPAPAGVEAEPPLADLGKSAAVDDDSRLVWLLLRARDEDGKWRFLLQQRPDGTWGMPGGKPHAGEDPWTAALRETEEEIGKFPPPYDCAGTFHHVEDDGKTQVYLYLCTVPYFHPTLGGATPEETRGAAWFRRKEVGNLDLAPKFREDWERGICLREHVTKAHERTLAANIAIANLPDPYPERRRPEYCWKNWPPRHTDDCGCATKGAQPLQRMVNENGEVLTLTPASQALQAVGSRWPYPHRSDGSEWPDAGPGAVPGDAGSAGGEPPRWTDDMAGPEPRDTLEPRGGDDGKMPSRGRKPNPPAEAFPNQGYAHDEAWPQPQATLTPSASPVGGNTGVPPSGTSKNDSGHPVVGSVPARTPEPYKPHTAEPEAFDPAETVEEWSPEAGSNVVHDLPKGAQHVTDANPVEWRHVYACMESNFPDSALEWVKHSTWHGPVHVPWSRVDDDDIDSWAASHQPGAVQRFAKEIARGGAHTEPSILVHRANHPDGREIVIDGHHRALARHFKLGKPVLAYVGTVPQRWMAQALQTHSSQLHQGDDPANKSAQTPVVSTEHHPLGHEGLWHTPDRHVSTVQQLPAYFQNTARALMRDQGMDEHRAIATAVNAVDEWRHGTAFGGKQKVTPQVQEAAQRAWDEWERLKESHHP